MRFESGWFSIPFGTPLDLYAGYWKLALAAAVLAYGAMRALKLYKRPQRGTFHAHVPRLVRGALTVTVALLVGVALVRNYYNVSTGVVLVFFFAFSLLLLAERALLFRVEILAARRALPTNRVLMPFRSTASFHGLPPSWRANRHCCSAAAASTADNAPRSRAVRPSSWTY